MDFWVSNWQRTILIGTACIILPNNALGSGTERHYRPPVVFQFNHGHAQWSQFLGKVITSGGKIDIDQMRKNAPLLNKYVDTIQSVARTEFYEFSQNEKTAFLINTHNSLLLKSILESDDPKTVLGLDAGRKIEIFGDAISVSDFFQKFIKRRISDPRAFLALFCLRPNCPVLYREAIQPEKVESQIEEITVSFFRDKGKNRYFSTDKSLVLSAFLKTYEYEIVKKYGSVGSFASIYMSSNQEFRKRARIGLIKVKYQD